MWSQGCRDQWRLYLLCVVTRRRNDLKGLSALCSLHHRYQWNRRSMYVLHPVVGANSESRLHRRFTYTVDQLMGLTINCTPLNTHFNPSIYKRHNSLQHGETKDKRIYSWALRRKKTIFCGQWPSPPLPLLERAHRWHLLLGPARRPRLDPGLIKAS